SISAYKLTHKTIGKNWLLWAIYLVSAAATVITETENILFFLGAGLIVWVLRAPPRPNAPSSAAAIVLPPLSMLSVAKAPLGELLVQIALFFTKAGAFVFGSGLAIVPF